MVYVEGMRAPEWVVMVRLAWDTLNHTESNANDISERMKTISVEQDHIIESALIQLANNNCYEGWEDELRYLLFRYEEHLAEQQGQRFRSEQWNRIWQESAAKSIEHIPSAIKRQPGTARKRRRCFRP